MASDIKFNVYYATSASGPWTQANELLIDYDSTGHYSFSVYNLVAGTKYFFRVVGGRWKSNAFIPLFDQVIGDVDSGGTTDLSSPVIPSPLEVALVSGINIPKFESLGHSFEVDTIV